MRQGRGEGKVWYGYGGRSGEERGGGRDRRRREKTEREWEREKGGWMNTCR